MGDWCSEEITDTRTQRNYGDGGETLNQRAGSIGPDHSQGNHSFPCTGEIFPLTGCLLMGDSANRVVYLWSPAPASVPAGYHKILGGVKRNDPTATSWGQGRACGIVEETICKAAYQLCRSLPYNDNATLAHIASDYDDRACGADTDSANLIP